MQVEKFVDFGNNHIMDKNKENLKMGVSLFSKYR